MTTFVKTDLSLFSLIPSDNITTHLRRCAADLLGLFKNWASKEKPGYWFKTRIKDLVEYLGGLYGKATISKAAKVLDELGIVKQHTNNKDGQIHTYYYEFCSQALKKLLGEAETSQAQAETSKGQTKTSQAQAETSSLYIDPLITDPAFSDPPTNECVDEEMNEEEIKAALTHLEEHEPTAAPPNEEPAPKKPRDLTPFFNRLRAIEVPLSGQIRELLSKPSEQQLHNNITALEEESAKNGLKSPIASCVAAITRNWQPRMDAQTWWNAAAKNLGRERRDKLIQNVTKLATPEGRQEVFVIFKSGRMLKLTEAYALDWDAIADYGRAAT